MTRARPMLFAALATLAITVVHHVYGAIIYATPFRLHAAAFAVPVGLVLGALAVVHARIPPGTGRNVAGLTLAALVILLPGLAIGAFEGGYNHLLKNLVYFGGASDELLARMFPPPTYELPNDAVFELSGIAQVVPGMYAIRSALRFVRG